jgi:putative membrane protein
MPGRRPSLYTEPGKARPMDIFILLPAIIHVYILSLESLLWDRPSTRRVFGLSSDEARVTKLFAWNQGFYNLLLAIAILVGWLLRRGILVMNGGALAGNVLILYGLASILIAGIVLFLSARRLWRSALVQVVPAFIGLIILQN